MNLVEIEGMVKIVVEFSMFLVKSDFWHNVTPLSKLEINLMQLICLLNVLILHLC